LDDACHRLIVAPWVARDTASARRERQPERPLLELSRMRMAIWAVAVACAVAACGGKSASVGAPGTDESNGSSGGSAGPQSVAAASIAAGAFHSCAVMTDKSVRCWGVDSFGAVSGTTSHDTRRAQPRVVAGVGDATAVAAGDEMTCSLTPAGDVRCWGGSYHGDGSDFRERPAPSSVALPSAATEIRIGYLDACARLVDGHVACWGDAADGALGVDTKADALSPVIIPGVENVVHVAVGNYAGCAQRADGAVFCWGYEMSTTGDTQIGVRHVDAFDGADEIAMSTSSNTACARLAGAVKCLGWSGVGTLDPSTSPFVARVMILPIEDAASIAIGERHICAALRNGSVRCVGADDYGQVSGATALANVVAVTCGANHACALLASGAMSCWGQGDDGQLGDGAAQSRKTPVTVAF
jgi:alpha-tubulin suppressor-like RCC1 family protein